MKEKELEKMLKGLKDMLEKSIDESGLREEFEEFKKKQKPNFKIRLETYKDREGYAIEVKGNRPSLCLALAELATSLMLETNLTKEDILELINKGIETAEEEE